MLVHYTKAACSPTGTASVRFYAASKWARMAEIGPHPSLLQAYSKALTLLPELAWLGLSIRDQHHHILNAGQVVRDAAAAAITAEQLSTAVEWLEQGRSVVWGQILNLRTPVDDLRKSHPTLADELVSLSTQLEAAGRRSDFLQQLDTGSPHSLQVVAQSSHAVADKRGQLLQQIRKLAGFERFLLPKAISELSLAAVMGRVVVLNVSQYRCDALILMPNRGDEVLHVPLPDLTLDQSHGMAKSLGDLLGSGGRTDRFAGQREGQLPPEEEFSSILSHLWERIFRPVLKGMAVLNPPRKNSGRIWWCPTGPLAFLPLHAAGLYGEQEAFGSKLSDFFISSYTPSLVALIQAFRAKAKCPDPFEVLAVAQPSALGQGYLPGTRDEVTRIKDLALGRFPVICLEQDMATVERVQYYMKTSRWVHFACHGVQDSFNPTSSALLVARSSRLTLSSIIQLSLPQAELAFLSACQTATGAQDLQDEAVHLTAGMLLAGYRGVIGTMWTIMDKDAPKVATDVYAHLFQTSPPDSTRAAEALHLAVRKLREESGGTKSFFHWVPFIHVGI
ncbi:CHAT domain-containing protein [Mycena galopus ATCC 62051]|nr:CHAT domain-containing protein [Mycena galopus ATCC 62051]